VYDVDVGLSQG